MIYWKDFNLEHFLGPVLEEQVCRSSADDQSSGVTDDASSRNLKAQGCALIQETRQGRVPARMVGQSSLEELEISMDADRNALNTLRLQGEG